METRDVTTRMPVETAQAKRGLASRHHVTPDQNLRRSGRAMPDNHYDAVGLADAAGDPPPD